MDIKTEKPREVLNHESWLRLAVGSRKAATLDQFAELSEKRIKVVPIEYSIFLLDSTVLSSDLRKSLSASKPVDAGEFFLPLVQELTVTGPVRVETRESAGENYKLVKKKVKILPVLFHFDEDVESELWESDWGFACMPSMGDGWTQYIFMDVIHKNSFPLVFRGGGESAVGYSAAMKTFKHPKRCFGSTRGPRL
jgi:hypothetical protein